jgi:hydroxymethylpyrimidine pyrophosphatase-like HAD family hydrolase
VISFALACDYDGTLATQGRVDEATRAALERLRKSGRKLILVTGRQLEDVIDVFPGYDVFDAIVAENGAAVYDASTKEVAALGTPPAPEFVGELQRRDVMPLSVGRVIVATWEPHEQTVLNVIRDLNLELQVIFNKGAVMVLPSGVNKASGLVRALDSLKLSPHNTVAVGDAENDLSFLDSCGCAVAVANALDSVKARANWVTSADHGQGVIELIDRILASDLEELWTTSTRDDITIGRTDEGEVVRLASRDGTVLIAGASGAGKTSLTAALLEQLREHRFQFLVIDPEGDYDELEGAIALRGADRRALADETLRVLDQPAQNAVVSLMDLRLSDRPEFVHGLLPRLLELRSGRGRPHWIVVDEAHHLLPTSWHASREMIPALASNLALVTVHPEHVSESVIATVATAVILGREPQATVDGLARGRSEMAVQLPPHPSDRPVGWLLHAGSRPMPFQPAQPAADRQRHRRKYAEGELGKDNSFYFRGPEGRLNLRAQNLEMFMQIADGVDDDTWIYHLRRADVSHWFRTVIKDEALADDASNIERLDELSAAESRARMRAAIERRYTTPA